MPVFDLSKWLDKELFTIGEYKVTVKDAAKLSVTAIILIIVGTCICLAISWWKRRQIAKAAKDGAEVVVRLSQKVSSKIRSSFSSRKTNSVEKMEKSKSLEDVNREE